ncbi:DUF397 domain-containing protein [Streptomyces halstedii]|uniref:DUF397 domain-containing protein n=1 Tax=Streptomyces halstedii TaxID=1944 RepID=UPI0036C2B43C
MTEPTSDVSAGAGWRKSSYSGNEGGSCLEVLDGHPTAVPVRDSKVPSGPVLGRSCSSPPPVGRPSSPLSRRTGSPSERRDSAATGGRRLTTPWGR